MHNRQPRIRTFLPVKLPKEGHTRHSSESTRNDINESIWPKTKPCWWIDSNVVFLIKSIPPRTVIRAFVSPSEPCVHRRSQRQGHSCQERVRKRHPRMFYRCLTHGALIRKKDRIPLGWCFRTHPSPAKLPWRDRKQIDGIVHTHPQDTKSWSQNDTIDEIGGQKAIKKKGLRPIPPDLGLRILVRGDSFHIYERDLTHFSSFHLNATSTREAKILLIESI